MRSIPLLDVNAVDVFDEIAAAKQQPRRGQMQNARAQVVAAYTDYEDAAPEVGELIGVPLSGQQKEAMRHAFLVETRPMMTLRGSLLNRVDVARCPFCGINETSTLDHYLPKERYPEFSVFPENLVPSCGICNTRKRDRVLDEGTNVRLFLHPCYDPIPDMAFLVVRTRMAANALILSYGLRRPAGMVLQTFQHLNSHFRQLGLADRYRRMGLEHLGGQHPALRRAFGPNSDAERVALKLVEVADDFEEAHGANYWLSNLYRALAGNDDFCNGGFEILRSQPQ